MQVQINIEPFAKDIDALETGYIGEVVYTAPNACTIFGEDENTSFRTKIYN